MIKRCVSFSVLLLTMFSGRCQDIKSMADSIRIAFHIPELALAVVSSDSIYEMQVSGYRKINSSLAARPEDKFRIGSNTKAITGMIAALLVRQGKLAWDTRFFDLYPELKASSDTAYYEVTLLQMLSMRTRLPGYSYTNSRPTRKQVKGNKEEQRYHLFAWLLKQPPAAPEDSVNLTNAGYVGAGLMLEKAAGMPYEQLVKALGAQLNIDFGFGNPNSTDSLQTWGHDENGNPVSPSDDYKLDWLCAAGNINTSLPEYVKFIQCQLAGLAGRSHMLGSDVFNFLHTGFSTFSVGWFTQKDEQGRMMSYNTGNPGTFITEVYVVKDINKAYILFTNAQTPAVYNGLSVLLDKIKAKYGGR